MTEIIEALFLQGVPMNGLLGAAQSVASESS